MTFVGSYYYPGFPLAEKFAWVDQKPGSHATDPTYTSLKNTGQALVESERDHSPGAEITRRGVGGNRGRGGGRRAPADR